MKLLIKFRHGLGDAVQLTYLITFLKQKHEDWHITVITSRGKDSILRGIADDVILSDFGEIDESKYDMIEDLSWWENRDMFENCPCTKAEKCLIDVFKEKPLNTKMVNPYIPPYITNIVNEFIKTEIGEKPFGLIHHQGNTATSEKNIANERAKLIAKQMESMGIIPVLLDWDSRSDLLHDKIICPNNKHPLWRGYGTGDGITILALEEMASLIVCIDSGPGHIASFSKTNTIQWWLSFHPIFYSHPSNNVTHLIRRDIHNKLPKNVRDFFEKNYKYKLHDGNEESIIAEMIELGKNNEFLDKDEKFIYSCGMWIRKKYAVQDMVLVGSVFHGDEYRTYLRGKQSGKQIVVDIGANIGSFAKRWHKINPEATIFCVEADPQNIPILKANVGEFATVINAACTYEEGEELCIFTSVFDNSGNTGGTTIMPKSEMKERVASGLYKALPNKVNTITLEEIVGNQKIDVLKLDCEGSEFSILRKTPSLNNIGFIFGEWHNKKMWEELMKDKFIEWDYGVMSDCGNIGIFHLRNPIFPNNGVLRWE